MNRRNFKYLLSITIILISILIESCTEQEYKTTDSGLNYKFEKEGTGPTPENGNVLVMNVSYMSASGNTIFSTANANGPMAVGFDDSLLSRLGGLEEGLKMIQQGDSMVLQYPIEDLFEETFNMPLPDSLERGSNVTVCIGVQGVYTPEEFQEYQNEENVKKQASYLELSRALIEADGVEIDKFLAENNLEARIDDSGIRYTILSEGNGDFPQNGETVRVNYTGKLMDGTIFDTSIEELAKTAGLYNPGRPYEPIIFPLGTGSVIKGWDIGIGLLRPGAKGVLYIPSSLAYGERGSGPTIAPNAILIFNVELVEIIK